LLHQPGHRRARRAVLDGDRDRREGRHPLPIAGAIDTVTIAGDALFFVERPRRLAPGSPARPVADIAVGPRHLYWLVDAGSGRLEVRSLSLPP